MHKLFLASFLFLVANKAQAYAYCHFYANGDCTGTQSVDFSVRNSNCFKAAGKSMKCHDNVPIAFKLVQSPNNLDTCNCQNHCFSYGSGNGCHNLAENGFNPNYHTYRFISSEDHSAHCNPNNCWKRAMMSIYIEFSGSSAFRRSPQTSVGCTCF